VFEGNETGVLSGDVDVLGLCASVTKPVMTAIMIVPRVVTIAICTVGLVFFVVLFLVDIALKNTFRQI